MKFWKIVLINLVLLSASTLALTWGSVYDVPDLLRVDYGFPFTWGRNTLSSIYGPVNLWDANVVLLAIDLLIWLVIVISTNLALHWKEERGEGLKRSELRKTNRR